MMASRLQHREPRSSLFSGYDATQARTKSKSPANSYSYQPSRGSSTIGAYPGASGSSMGNGSEAGFRSATPNNRGQYSDAVLSELESQNDDELQGMSARVRALKDITSAIGVEIRDSTALAEKMNESFEGTSAKLKGTMNRMLRMAEKTGVSWKIWLGFFAAVVLLFWFVRFS